jgi:hypothetical protein
VVDTKLAQDADLEDDEFKTNASRKLAEIFWKEATSKGKERNHARVTT